MARLFVLFGAPGSGKSLVLKRLASRTNGTLTLIPKETTRAPRETDGPETVHVKALSEACDFRYSQYGHEYGFSSRQIWESLEGGSNAGLIANDIRSIRLLKQHFGPMVRTVYVHANIDQRQMTALTRKRYGGRTTSALRAELRRRVEKIKTVHRKYIENTALFDYTILNAYEKPTPATRRALYRQVDAIVTDGGNTSRRLQSSVKIFIIVGGSYSGKDELVTAMQRMAFGSIVNYQKATSRPMRVSDRGELRHFDIIPDTFDITYSAQGFTYGISSHELWGSLREGKISLLVISDLEAISRVVGIFGPVCTRIYLHANFNFAEIRQMMKTDGMTPTESEKRVDTIRGLQRTYVDSMPRFEHVLLNTAEPEDLYDQAFNIVDFYTGSHM